MCLFICPLHWIPKIEVKVASTMGFTSTIYTRQASTMGFTSTIYTRQALDNSFYKYLPSKFNIPDTILVTGDMEVGKVSKYLPSRVLHS